MRILFDSKDKIYKSVFGPLREGEGCRFNVHIPKSCKTKNVDLVFNREDGAVFSAYSMFMEGEYGDYEIFSADVCFAKTGLFFYYFVITTENERFSLYKQGYDMTNMEEGDYWQLSVIPKGFDVPDYYKGNIMYQIFPDRFFKYGSVNTEGKLKPYTLHTDTEDIPCFLPDEKGIVQNNDFFGGNLKGITKKLDYLSSLNVGVIYLNPIFKAYSNHRYDTADYHRIDELLGDTADFEELCREAHKRGIKVVLDGVFSHTGSNSVYFDSEGVFGNGAVSCPDSPYRSWFDFKRYPDEYTSWWGIKTLPCVNENDPGYREYIIDGEDSVIAHWIKAGADGFRLDVADELPDSFIKDLRERMKGLNKDSFLVGEVWEDASNKSSYSVRRRYFTDGELDSVMNYPFRKAVIDYVSQKDNGEFFRDTVMTIAENYPKCVLDSLMNILSTHDTPRILSFLGVDEIPSEKGDRAVYKLSDDLRRLGKERLLCAVFLQFILPGMPCIYYGDEIGTEGFEDPFCRSYFMWDKTNENDILDFYREISAVKKQFSVLRNGDIEVSVISEGVLKLRRCSLDGVVTAYVNTGSVDFILEEHGRVILSRNCLCDGNKKLTKNNGFILFCN